MMRLRAREKTFLVLVTMISAFAGCRTNLDEGSDPKDVLKSYMTRSFSVSGVSDRKELEFYLTGEAKSRLASWSDEQFLKAFIDSRRKFRKLVFRESQPISDDEVHLTYELSYADESKGHASTASITHRKMCTLRKIDGKWKISEVKSLKELVEYENEMSLP